MRNRLLYSGKSAEIELRKISILYEVVAKDIEQPFKAMCGIIRMKMLRRLIASTKSKHNGQR